MNAPKTPPSLKWLLNRRARLTGELDKIQEAEISRLTAHQAELVRIEAERLEICDLNASAVSAYESLREALGGDLRAITKYSSFEQWRCVDCRSLSVRRAAPNPIRPFDWLPEGAHASGALSAAQHFRCHVILDSHPKHELHSVNSSPSTSR